MRDGEIREAIWLRMRGLTWQEVAEEMGKPLGMIYDNVVRHPRPLGNHATTGRRQLLSVENS